LLSRSLQFRSKATRIHPEIFPGIRDRITVSASVPGRLWKTRRPSPAKSVASRTFCILSRIGVRLLRLRKGRMTKNLVHEQPIKPLANYLRAHRRKTGLTQHDLARVLGYVNRDAVSRHERLESMPSLLIALSYEVLYRVPVSEIFAGLAETVEFNVEAQLAQFEVHLGEQSAGTSRAAAIARKLEWLTERRGSG
jgi:DNA-binding XRE family transcriptional regulator